MQVTESQLMQIMPRLKKPSTWLPLLNEAMAKFQINTPLRASAFLAQLAHESGQLRYMEELASGEAYEGRKDLGNVKPGDGKKYKGRGPIQLTGRGNYGRAGRELALPLEATPELVATPKVGLLVAGWFWSRAGLNLLADAKEFDRITRKINGGYNGKADRDKYYKKACAVFGC